MTIGPSAQDQRAVAASNDTNHDRLDHSMPVTCADDRVFPMADGTHKVKASPSPLLQKALAAAYNGETDQSIIDAMALPGIGDEIDPIASSMEVDHLANSIGVCMDEEDEEEEAQAMKDVAMELVQGGILDDLDEGNGSDSLFGNNASFAEQMHASMNHFNTPQLTPLQSPAVGNLRTAHQIGSSHGVVDDFGTTLEELDVVSSGSVLTDASVMEKACSETEESSCTDETDSGDEDAELQLIHLFEGDWCDIAWRWDWLALQYAEAKHHLSLTERKIRDLKQKKKPAYKLPADYQGCARTLQFNNRAPSERPAIVHKVPTKVILRTKFEPHPLSASDKNFAHRVALRAPAQPKPSQLKLPNSPYLRRSVPCSPSSLRSATSSRRSSSRTSASRQRSSDSIRKSDNTLDQIVLTGGTARKIRKIEYKEIFTPTFRQIEGVREASMEDEEKEDSGSSDEDTSDEKYMRLHAPKEQDEHNRFLAACGEDPQKKVSRRGNSNQQKPSAEQTTKQACKKEGPPRKFQRLSQSGPASACKTIPDAVYITSREVDSPRASPKTPSFYDLPVRKSSRPHKPSALRRKLEFSPTRDSTSSCSSGLRSASTAIPVSAAGKRSREDDDDDDESNAWKIARTEEEGKKNVLVLRKISVP